MRRPLASALAAFILLAVPASSRAAEPLDVELSRLGAPSAAAWTAMGVADAAVAGRLASEAKARFGVLSTDMALAISNAILAPASTTGYAGFDFALEASYAQVSPRGIGTTATAGFTPPATTWPTRSMTPHELFVPSFHVRKALPFSFELGGRILYLSQSSYFGAQIEGKWALNEGFDVLPDLAVRFAWTQLYGQRDWNLGTGDVDLMVSKRWGVNAVTSFTPYAAARFTMVNASTDPIVFRPATDTEDAIAAEFPTMRQWVYRTTAGVRMTAYAVSMALEGTWSFGATYDGKAAPGADQYPTFEVPSTFGGAFRFGFEF